MTEPVNDAVAIGIAAWARLRGLDRTSWPIGSTSLARSPSQNRCAQSRRHEQVRRQRLKRREVF